MRGSRLCLAGALAVVLLLAGRSGGWCGEEVLFREEFENLDKWKILTFPGIPETSRYGVGFEEGVSCLKAESSDSASGLIYTGEYQVRKWPGLRWRWRTDHVYRGGDARKKDGDDYPLRLYVLFPYDPELADLKKKVIFGAARVLHGEYPPQSALNYIWANREHEERFIPNAYTGRSVMIVRRGPGDTGAWHEEKVNVVEDYRQAFGREPPPRARLAVMNDSDDTGEKSVSFIDYIEVFG